MKTGLLVVFVSLFSACSGPGGSTGGGSGGGSAGGGGSGGSGGGIVPELDGGVLRAVRTARATAIPACTLYVDAAAAAGGDGSKSKPYETLGAAVSAAVNDAVICVAQGTYPEQLTPMDKPLTLAGGFQSGQMFTVRDSALYPSKAQGPGSGSFFKVEDPAPTGTQRTVIDGFEITGYARAVVRATYYAQRFDLTNNFIHDNDCGSDMLIGGGFAFDNISGTIGGNIFLRNTCGRGGAGALVDSTGTSNVVFERNRVEANVGMQPMESHGGGFYLFGKNLVLDGNEFVGNRATGWGGGLWLGADPQGETAATLRWNVYRDNRAGVFGGGLFCDDSGRCASQHELFDGNCGGNILLDSGNTRPTIASFDHATIVNGRSVDCLTPWAGIIINKDNTAPDAYTVTNSLFWGNEAGRDFDASCQTGCANVTVGVSSSNVQKNYADGGVGIAFAPGTASVDPAFVDAATHDFHLKSTKGHWTPAGFVNDAVDSPALGKATGGAELGVYGNSAEASKTQ